MATIVYKEVHEQRLFVKWFYLEYPNEKIAAFCNGGKRTALQTKLLIYEGLLPGICDLIILTPKYPYHSLFLEMKRTKGGVISKEQKDMILHLKSKHYKAEVSKGWEVARDITLEYMSLPDWRYE